MAKKSYTIGSIKKEIQKICPDCTISAKLPFCIVKNSNAIVESCEPEKADKMCVTFNYGNKSVVVEKTFSFVEYLEDGTRFRDVCVARPNEEFKWLDDVSVNDGYIDRLFIPLSDLKPVMAENPEFDRAVRRVELSRCAQVK